LFLSGSKEDEDEVRDGWWWVVTVTGSDVDEMGESVATIATVLGVAGMKRTRRKMKW